MGELFDKVLNIINNRINEEKDYFNSEIIKINESILNAVENGSTGKEIKIVGIISNHTAYPDTYYYILKHYDNKDIIIKWIKEYYRHEGFKVKNKDNIVIIEWGFILDEIMINESKNVKSQEKIMEE